MGVQAPGEVGGLVGHDADGHSVESGEPDDDVRGEVLVDLEEMPVVDDEPDDVLDVVGLVRIERDDRLERFVAPSGRVRGQPDRRVVHVVRRHVPDELADHEQGVVLVLGREVGHPALRGVGHGPAELLLGHVLVGHGLDDVRPGHEHVGVLLDHQDEIGDGGRIDRPAGARPQDDRDLGDDARSEGVAEEDVGVAAQADHAFLDAGAAGVVQADDGRPVLHGQVHDLADLLGVGAGERPAPDGEVLGEDEDEPVLDPAVPGHDAVAEDLRLFHAEVRRSGGS